MFQDRLHTDQLAKLDPFAAIRKELRRAREEIAAYELEERSARERDADLAASAAPLVELHTEAMRNVDAAIALFAAHVPFTNGGVERDIRNTMAAAARQRADLNGMFNLAQQLTRRLRRETDELRTAAARNAQTQRDRLEQLVATRDQLASRFGVDPSKLEDAPRETREVLAARLDLRTLRPVAPIDAAPPPAATGRQATKGEGLAGLASPATLNVSTDLAFLSSLCSASSDERELHMWLRNERLRRSPRADVIELLTDRLAAIGSTREPMSAPRKPSLEALVEDMHLTPADWSALSDDAANDDELRDIGARRAAVEASLRRRAAATDPPNSDTLERLAARQSVINAEIADEERKLGRAPRAPTAAQLSHARSEAAAVVDAATPFETRAAPDAIAMVSASTSLDELDRWYEAEGTSKRRSTVLRAIEDRERELGKGDPK